MRPNEIPRDVKTAAKSEVDGSAASQSLGMFLSATILPQGHTDIKRYIRKGEQEEEQCAIIV